MTPTRITAQITPENSKTLLLNIDKELVNFADHKNPETVYLIKSKDQFILVKKRNSKIKMFELNLDEKLSYFRF